MDADSGLAAHCAWCGGARGDKAGILVSLEKPIGATLDEVQQGGNDGDDAR
jgi:hypothetical protein